MKNLRPIIVAVGLVLAISSVALAQFTGRTPIASAAGLLADILTVDGSGSLLDADKLDGVDSLAFMKADGSVVATGATTFNTAGGANLVVSETTLARSSGSDTTIDFDNPGAGAMHLTVNAGAGTVWDSQNDGASSTLDADLLDGISSATFGLADATNLSASGLLTKILTVDGAASTLDADLLDGLSSAAFALADATNLSASGLLTQLLTVDGASSGLDADLLDGVSSAGFAVIGGNTFTASQTINSAGGTNAEFSEGGVDKNSGASETFNIQNSGAGTMSLQVDGSTVPTLATDGSGSTLDADLLDGISSAGFCQVAGGSTCADTVTTTTTSLDISAGSSRTIGISGNTTFTGSNYCAGCRVELKITATGGPWTIGVPANWVGVGAADTSLASGKIMVCSITSWTTADTGVTYSCAEQP